MSENKTVKFPQIDQSCNSSVVGLNKSLSSKSNGQRKSMMRRNSIIEEYEQTPADTVKANQFEQKKQELYYSSQNYQNNKLIHKKNSVYLNQDNHNTYKQAFKTEKNISAINKVNEESAALLKKIKRTQDTVDSVIQQNENMLDNNQNKLSQTYDLRIKYKDQGVHCNELNKNIKKENQELLKNQKHSRKLQNIELDLCKLLDAIEQKFVKISYERNQYVAILDKKGKTKRQSIQLSDLQSSYLSK